MPPIQKYLWILFSILSEFWIPVTQAQTILPAPNNTGTIVTPSEHQIDISGGAVSADGSNIFHNFTRFNVDYGKLVNFLSTPNIRNILTSVNGGEVSFINGTLQVSGSNANLFLMNPAGIVFGRNASLNVPADFTATTASAIGFNQGKFNGANNDYSNLVGAPQSFYFSLANPATIVNLGNLAVSPGSNLNLLAGSVLSTGTLSAPQGNLIIATVAGGNSLKISQPGHLLSLEINPVNASQFSTLESLPPLLTGGNLFSANQLKLNPDGSIQLTLQQGDIAVQNLSAGNALLAAQNNLTITGGMASPLQLNTTGDMRLAAGNTVKIHDNALTPVQIQAGGNLTIQGKQNIDILALNHPGVPLQSRGNLTLSSDGIISADAHLQAGGNVSILNLTGNPGKFVSLYDPIIRSNGDVVFGDYTGASLKIEAKGSITGGDITITSPDTTLTANPNDPDIEILTTRPALILRADSENLTPIPENNQEIIINQTNVTKTEQPLTTGITVNNIKINNPNTPQNPGGPVILSAKGPIITAGIESFGGEIRLNSSNQFLEIAEKLDSAGGNMFLEAQSSIRTTNILTQGGNLTLKSNTGNITNLGTYNTTSPIAGGNIDINTPGNIITGNLSSGTGTINIFGNSVDAGNNSLTTQGAGITVNAQTNLTTGNITTNGGDIFLNSVGENVNTTAGTIEGKNITINAQRNIETGTINSQTGAISLSTKTGDIDSNRGNLTANSITLNAEGNLKTNNLTSPAGTINLTAKKLITTAPATVSVNSETNSSGQINITTSENIVAGALTANSLTSNGGNITVSTNNGNITTGNIYATGINGGTINITAPGTLTLKALKANTITQNPSPQPQQAGTITLSSNSNITVNSIQAEGANGGTILLSTAGLFRALETFLSPNNIPVSISAAGSTTEGKITLQHNGGCNTLDCTPPAPFSVGNNTNNSSAGALITGPGNIILPGQSFPATYIQGNIAIITATPPEAPPIIPPLPPTEEPQNPLNNLNNTQLNRDLTSPNSSSSSNNSSSSNSNLSGIINIQNERLSISQNQQMLDASVIRLEIDNLIQANKISQAISKLEQLRIANFENYYGRKLAEAGADPSIEKMIEKLKFISEQTNTKPALLYTFLSSNQLEMIAVTYRGNVIHRSSSSATPQQVLLTSNLFQQEITNPLKIKSREYLKLGEKLYSWVITPLEADLEKDQVDTLLFSMDPYLRSLPIAVLSHNNKYLIEKYRYSLVPSLILTNTDLNSPKNQQVLAMGASTFENLATLPAVPTEISTITNQLRTGKNFLNEAFTVSNLEAQHQTGNYSIIHLATHGEFQPGDATNSYIQFWDQKLNLQQLQQLQLNAPNIDLLVLSACRTALGDEKAELGFAGLAVQSGAKSALASLWYVSDAGTLALMLEFYRQLNQTSNKAEALRQAQLSLIRGNIQIKNQQLILPGLTNSVSLPRELTNIENLNFSHPYYWGAFTIIGSPW